MLVRQCGRPLEYDREQELGMLEKQDTQLRAQAVRLERTTRNLEEQKRQLQKHYKETEDVGKKLESYKGKLAAVRFLCCCFGYGSRGVASTHKKDHTLIRPRSTGAQGEILQHPSFIVPRASSLTSDPSPTCVCWERWDPQPTVLAAPMCLC